MINFNMKIESNIQEFYNWKILSNSKSVDKMNGDIQLINENQEIEIFLEGVYWSQTKGVLWTILYGLHSVISGLGDPQASTLKPFNYHYKFNIPKDEKNIYVTINEEMDIEVFNTNNQKISVEKNIVCKKSYLSRWALFISLPIISLTIINILLARTSYCSTNKGILKGLLVIGIVGELVWIHYNYKAYREAKKAVN